MKAMVFREYGTPDVLHMEEVSRPIPKENEVLIRVKATTVTAGDWRMRKAQPFVARLYNGLLRPRKVNILGFELAGVVEQTGSQAAPFQPGDQVFAFAGLKFGAYAEYICLPVDGNQNKGIVALKPSNLSYEEAAAVPLGGLAALNLLCRADIKAGKKVLINGASGSVGTYAVQIARNRGAQITAVCSGKNFEMVRSLGADRSIDYTKEDFTTDVERYDVIFDAVDKVKPSRAKTVLTPGGIYLNIGQSRKDRPQDLVELKDLCEAGRLHPVIDKVFPFDHISDAHRYVEKGHKVGNVVINLN